MNATRYIGAPISWRGVQLTLLGLMALSGVIEICGAGSLEDDFRDPPVAARPYVWWHWMGPNFSKEGITKNLEAMKASGNLWHPPFVRDITSALQPGANTLELAVANTWHNRLVGDEQFPPDFEFGTDRREKMGRALKAYPDWFVKNQPRPETNRLAFVNWFYHRKDTPLIPSGLIGPVQLVPVAESVLKP